MSMGADPISTLEGIHVILTGAGAGLGLAMARTLVEAGAQVLAVDLVVDALQKCGMTQHPALDCLACDISAADAPAAIVRAAQEHFGRPANVLVNNAGIGRNAYAPDYLREWPRTWEIADAIWKRFFEVNTLGAIRLTNAVVAGMVQEGWGRIVTVTTSLDSMLKVGAGPYGASKAALEAYAASLGAELAGSHVTSNVLVPGGPVDTSMVPLTRGLDRGTLLQPDVMSAPLRWLVSKESDGVTQRRFRASLWDPALPVSEAAEAAGAPVAWSALAVGQMRPLRLAS